MSNPADNPEAPSIDLSSSTTERNNRGVLAMRVFSSIVRAVEKNDPSVNTMLLAFCYQLLGHLGQMHQPGMMRSHATMLSNMLIDGAELKAAKDAAPEQKKELLEDLRSLFKRFTEDMAPMTSRLTAKENEEDGVNSNIAPLLSVPAALFSQLLTITLLATQPDDITGMLEAAVNGSLPARAKLVKLFKTHTRHLLPSTITQDEQNEYEAWLNVMANDALRNYRNEH